MPEVYASEKRFQNGCDTDTVQAAIDSFGPSGGTVVIPRWNPRSEKTEWRFPKPIVLKSNVTLVIDNAVLVQETGSFTHLITAEPGAGNISLIGEGNACLSGGAVSRLKPLTAGKYGLPAIECGAMCLFRDVAGLTVRNLEIEDPHWFAFVLDNVRKASLRNIRFSSYPRVPQEGGVLLRGGSREITIENLTGRTGTDTVEIAAADGREISDIHIRNILTDPARGALLRLSARDGGRISDIGTDLLMDSSDFYEKARSGACMAFGRPEEDIPDGTISEVSADHLYSRAANAIDIRQPFSDTIVKTLMTFGDNIAAIGSSGTRPVALGNVVFDCVFYGAGSEPNNASSFISRAAKGAKAVRAEAVSGFTVNHLHTPEEEA